MKTITQLQSELRRAEYDFRLAEDKVSAIERKLDKARERRQKKFGRVLGASKMDVEARLESARVLLRGLHIPYRVSPETTYGPPRRLLIERHYVSDELYDKLSALSLGKEYSRYDRLHGFEFPTEER